MLLIIAPSKTQKPATTLTRYNQPTIPLFLDKSTQLIAELQQFPSAQLAELMKTSEKLTNATYRQIHNFTTPFHPDNATPAIHTFQGDAYEMINSTGYTAAQLEYAQNHLRILSGLYGMLRPLDLMQPYRLEMGLKFTPPQAKNLYQFWKKTLTIEVIEQLGATEERCIVNLASNEYAKVLDQKMLAEHNCRFLDITFQQPHRKAASGYKTIPIHSKRARGMMVDFAINNEVVKAEQLLSFCKKGYSISTELSTDTNWIFRQNQ